MREFGIDVSVHQKGFDFARAKKEGVKFAILRAAYSEPRLAYDAGKDTAFEQQYVAAKNAGLPIGSYQYSLATSIDEAKGEAEFMIACLKGKQFELPIYIDIEDDVQKRLGKRLLTDIVKTWCGILEKNGYYAGIYSSTSFFSEYLYDGELTAYTHWVAQWDTACTYVPASLCGMWQFGGETNLIRSNIVAGVVCDQNYLLKDFTAEIKSRGLNGFVKTTTPATKPTTPKYDNPGEITYQVMDKRWWPAVNSTTKSGTESYAGDLKSAICCVRAKGQHGKITLQAHIKGGGWLPKVSKYDETTDGYAGVPGKSIDALKIWCEYGHCQMRVKTKDGWLAWIDSRNCNGTDSESYAGVFGKDILAVQIK